MQALCELYNRPDASGKPQAVLNVGRVHARHGCRWQYPIHEVITSSKGSSLFIRDFIITHKPDEGKSRGNYLPMLERAERENPEDTRSKFYLAREYFYYRMYDKCIGKMREYLEIGWWREERSDACRKTAACHIGLEEPQKAYYWFSESIRECPGQRDNYLEFAQFCYDNKNFAMGFLLLQHAIDVITARNGYNTSERCWNENIYDLAALCAHYSGRNKEAYSLGRKAAEMKPGDERLKKNLEHYEKRLR